MAARTLRRDVDTLVRQAEIDLAILWRDAETPAAAEAALRDILPALIDEYGVMAATIAAEWYDQLRLDGGVGGSFTAVVPDTPDSGSQALVGWALATAAGYPAFKTLILGGTQRRIANFSRFTVTGSAVADPQASGWVRTGVGACKSGWCDQFLDGEIRTVPYDFPAHDNCNCHATPAF